MAPIRTRDDGQLAEPNGIGILQTKAKKDYGLAKKELESILPVSVTPNIRGRQGDIVKYNERDVRDLHKRIRDHTPIIGTGDLAETNGPQILHTTAMRKYDLELVQMQRIKPTSLKPNPHGGTSQMKHYNVKDVEALVAGIAAATAPTSREGNSEGTAASPAKLQATKRKRADIDNDHDRRSRGRIGRSHFDIMDMAPGEFHAFIQDFQSHRS